MKDNINNNGQGFFGKSVSSWCSPPNGPPEKINKLTEYKDKALPSTVDGKDRMEGIPNPWFTGPPKNNVIPFEEVENKKWRDEIKEIENHFQDTDSFSQDRNQLLLLLSAIVLNPKIDIKIRKQACHTVVRHSNLRLLIESVLCGCDDCESLQDVQKGFDLVDKAFAAQ